MNEFIVNWPAPQWVKTFTTVRQGGVSVGPWASLNLGDHVQDVPEHVAINRQRVEQYIKVKPHYLKQVHGTTVVRLDDRHDSAPPEADAAILSTPGKAAVVLTADCMPLLFCHATEKVVAVAHAGWRGLAQGVIEKTIQAMGVTTDQLLVWIGPTISQSNFEVGQEVRDVFMQHNRQAASAFKQTSKPGKWQANLVALAKQQLHQLGITAIYGGETCNYQQADLFYSHRRDVGLTGRMGYFIWIDDPMQSNV
ncbi:MAG: hypothetical protein B7X47_03040 [Ferrovum sp. 34-44-207]|uniref:peptidoglycan editing factor PgeF n=1 Tax=Ferrovum sp. JA12 TaxID=1356299 RepID=UPI0007035C9E|nr:peptidoglycan editing factor PgeF [Ferrovum sp. JA12]KRH79861.1 laccase domain protein YfiH [Ferrovum sp. JA12]OYV80710.1 MAG: hypothetical protein B7Z65_00510 [Ferrovum sp. 21-44-67]OZB33719.1 MAG: hypothetical protein B7X47_03040 [Ferrovum sp. 34-44-207]HQU05977.1 peptidoglycan editing factor PgeF [Ferrovaceae bacterium]